MVERLLTPDQRKRYNRILATKGKAEADAFKQKIAGGDGSSGGEPDPAAAPTKKEKKRARLSPDNKKFLQDLKETKRVGEKAGLTGNPDLIESPQVDALTDPSNPAFIGKPTKAEQDWEDKLNAGADALTNPDGTPKVSDLATQGIDAVKKAMETVGLQTPEMKSLIDKLMANYDSAGERPEDVKEALQIAKGNIEKAGKEDPRLTSTFKMMEEGLLGLKSPELQALRENMNREIQGDYLSKQRKLNDMLARSRATGGAALSAQNQLDKENSDLKGKTEQDLLLKNVDIMDKRRKEYSDALMTNDSNLKTATNAAIKTYGDTLNTAVSNENTAKAAAGKILSDTMTQDEKTRLDAKVQATNDYGTLTAQVSKDAQEAQSRARELAAKYIQQGDTARADLLLRSVGLKLDVEKFNAEQKTNDKAATVALYTGQKGIKIAEKTAEQTDKLISEQGDSGGSGDGEPDTTSAEKALDDVETEVKDQMNGKKKKKKA